MLTSKPEFRVKVQLPHEPGQWIEIKHLSATELQLCQKVRTDKALRELADQADIHNTLQSVLNAGPDRAERKPTRADIHAQYDMATVLHLAVKGWSYQYPVNDENIDDLDRVTVEMLLDTLLPGTESEEDRKNGIWPSTTRLMETAPSTTSGS